MWFYTCPTRWTFITSCLFHIYYNNLTLIYQTRESVSSDFQTQRREWTTWCTAKYFCELWGVWKSNETLAQVFDISSQLKLKLWRKRRYKILKIIFMVIKNTVTVLIFFVLNWWIINEFKKANWSLILTSGESKLSSNLKCKHAHPFASQHINDSYSCRNCAWLFFLLKINPFNWHWKWCKIPNVGI